MTCDSFSDRYIQAVVDDRLSAMEGRAECDLIAEYTAQIPIAVIAKMLAIPSAKSVRSQRS